MSLYIPNLLSCLQIKAFEKYKIMDIAEEEENLIKARKFIEDVLLPLLRDFFKAKWNAKRNPNESDWGDSPNDGNALVKKLKGRSLDKNVYDKLKRGKTDEWDATCLFEAIMTVVTEQENAKEYKSISTLRTQRNKVFHKEKHTLSCIETERFYTRIEKSFNILKFQTKSINKFTTDHIVTPEMKQLNEDNKKLKGRLESEKMKGKLERDCIIIRKALYLQ